MTTITLPPSDQPGVDAATVRAGTLRIGRHFNGPRRSANGGFAAGTIATRVDAETVTVVLRRPVRLGVPLDVFEIDADEIAVRHRRTVIAEGRPGALVSSAVPAAPTLDDARLARDAHPLAGVRHPLSKCVVCSPARADGMQVTPGPVPGRPGILASPWVVRAPYAHAGIADFPVVWAAMDCPSYPATALASRILCLLGTMTARIERRPRVGEHLVVYGWTREHHGRRYQTSVAMVDAHGALIAQADASWIALKRQGLLRLAAHLRGAAR